MNTKLKRTCLTGLLILMLFVFAIWTVFRSPLVGTWELWDGSAVIAEIWIFEADGTGRVAGRAFNADGRAFTANERAFKWYTRRDTLVLSGGIHETLKWRTGDDGHSLSLIQKNGHKAMYTSY